MLRIIGNLWCKLTHKGTTWPIHGQYECRICGRRYPVPWEFRELSYDLNDSAMEAESPWRKRLRKPGGGLV